MSYRICAALTCLLVAGLDARAAEPSPRAIYQPLSSLKLEDQIDSARFMRTSGAVLTIASVAMAVGSLVMTGVAVANGLSIDCSNSDACHRAEPLFNAAIGVAATSSVLMGVGVPLWAVGSSRLYELDRERLRLSVAPSPDGRGARAGVSVAF